MRLVEDEDAERYTVLQWDGSLPKVGKVMGSYSHHGPAVADARRMVKSAPKGSLTCWVVRESDGVVVYNRGRVDEK